MRPTEPTNPTNPAADDAMTREVRVGRGDFIHDRFRNLPGHVVNVSDEECEYATTINGKTTRIVADWSAICVPAAMPDIPADQINLLENLCGDPFYEMATRFTRQRVEVLDQLNALGITHESDHAYDRIDELMRELIASLNDLSANNRYDWMMGRLGVTEDDDDSDDATLSTPALAMG